MFRDENWLPRFPRVFPKENRFSKIARVITKLRADQHAQISHTIFVLYAILRIKTHFRIENAKSKHFRVGRWFATTQRRIDRTLVHYSITWKFSANRTATRYKVFSGYVFLLFGRISKKKIIVFTNSNYRSVRDDNRVMGIFFLGIAENLNGLKRFIVNDFVIVTWELSTWILWFDNSGTPSFIRIY